jgi:hypothetical protein
MADVMGMWTCGMVSDPVEEEPDRGIEIDFDLVTMEGE